MKRHTFLLLVFLSLATGILAQKEDTIFISNSRPVVLRIKSADVFKTDFSKQFTDQNRAGLPEYKSIYVEADSVLNTIKMKAFRNFKQPAQLIVMTKTESKSFLVIFDSSAKKIDYSFSFAPPVITEPAEEEKKPAKVEAPVEKTFSDEIGPEKRKLFAAARSKQPNINDVSRFDHQLSVVLSKIYQDKEQTCFSISLFNYLKTTLELGSVEVSLLTGSTVTPVPAVIEESAFAPMGKWAKTNFSIIVENLKMPVESTLQFTFKYKDTKYSDLVLELKKKKFEKRELIY